MKTAVIYARYSSDNQTEQSIEGQLRVCNEYAKSNDLIILQTYIDRAMTGTNDHRPAFQQMLTDSERGKWEVVLVYALDRFGRNSIEMVINKQRLKKNGKILISATQRTSNNLDGSTNLDGIILENFYIGLAEYYSVELSQKVKRGMNETRLKGNFTGGSCIYGFKVVDHKVEINEAEAEIVRFIYEQYAQGVYVKDIIAELKRRGIYNKGKPFAKNTVYNILKNEKYSGIYRYKDEVFENMYPRIVPPETYKIVRAKIDLNKYGSRSVEVVYLLRNKIKCGYCGSPISAETGTAKNGVVRRYYKCLGRKRHNGCTKAQERKEVLENYVIENLTKELSKPKTIDQITTKLLELQERRLRENSALTLLIKEKRQTENAINNIMGAIEQGGTSPTVMSRLRELETKLEEIKRQTVIEQSKQAYRLTKDEIQQFYQAGLEKDPLRMINLFVKEILLFDDKMIITYNTPQQNDLGESQGFSFYDKTVKIPFFFQDRNNLGFRDFRLIMTI